MPDLATLADAPGPVLLDADTLPVVRPGVAGAAALLLDATMARLAAYMATKPISYAQLPFEVANLPVPFFHSGPTFANETSLMFVVSQPVYMPAALAGTLFLAMTAATANVVFILWTYHAGIWTALGTLTVQPSGAIVVSATPGVTLATGDAFRMTGPPLPDATLRDFSFCFQFVKV